jgi:stage II sporulation protein D (peptidoglycan lytic transglycosylase)
MRSLSFSPIILPGRPRETVHTGIFLLWIGLLCLPAWASASENIRVALADHRKNVVVRSDYGLVMEGRPGSAKKKLVFNSATMSTAPVRVKSAGEFVSVNGKVYRGWMDIRKQGDGLLVINDLDIEDYLQGVVASEIPHDWQYEALKAQAVAARTYALYQKKTAGRRLYHVSATVASQVYVGREGERPRAARAVEDTRGLVIVYHGEIIPAFFHASCGGHTENAFELWGIDAPYLQGVDCDCQEISRYGLWEVRVGKAQIISALRQMGYHVGDILGINIKGITPAGRVREVVIGTSKGKRYIPAEPLRAALGNTLIPSVFFELAMEGDEAVFSGRGMGHGVGLCQWGAEEMAEKGSDFEAILAHYYPGTSLMRLP